MGLRIVALNQRVTAQESGRSVTLPTVVMGVCSLAAAALIGYGLYLVAFA